MKKYTKKITKALIKSAVLALVIIKAFDTDIKVREYSINTDKVKKRKKFVLITDLHSGLYGYNQSELIERINEIAPDAVLFGGDIIESLEEDRGGRLLFEAIGRKYRCFYVTGNHEYRSRRVNEIKEMIRGYGVNVLEGSGISLDDEITVWGTDDPCCRFEKYGAVDNWYRQFFKCSSGADKSKYNIYLSHRPERTDEYENSKFDLILCGHAHGGQWRIPVLLNGLYAPNQGMFPKYAGGRYKLGSVDMIVSRGLKMSFLPRIFNPPEIVVVNIGDVKQEKSNTK